MRVNVYYSGDPVHDRALSAFTNGCPYDPDWLPVHNYTPSDVAVVFGIEKKRVPKSQHRGRVIREQQARGLKVVVLETGYVNRGDGPQHHYAAGFGNINGWADFRNKDMPDDRWRKLGAALRPMRPVQDDGVVILCAQVPWDASVQHIDMWAWLSEAVERLRKATARKIVYRPHPMAVEHLPRGFGHCETSHYPLAHDLKRAHALVAYNSNSLVEAVIAGVPIFPIGRGSMVDDLGSCGSLATPRLPDDREQWAAGLAYCQWNLAEMQSGETWRHLFR